MPLTLILCALLIILSCRTLIGADASEATTNALHAALARNIDHAKEWLDQKDFKSVAHSAGGLELVAELLKARGDGPAWRASLDHVLSAVNGVKTAARDESAANSKTAIELLQKAAAAAAALKPTGDPHALSQAPSIRSLMLTMDAIQGDAKVAVLTGNSEAAKQQVYVLTELGKLVSSSRNTDQWSTLAGDFVSAAQAAATSSDTDPKAVRQQLRAVAAKCDACHEKNRTRQ